MAKKKKWWEDLPKVERNGRYITANLGSGADTKIDPNKPVMMDFNGNSPRSLHEGESIVMRPDGSRAVVSKNDADVLLGRASFASNEKQQDAIAAVEQKYGIQGFQTGTDNFGATDLSRLNPQNRRNPVPRDRIDPVNQPFGTPSEDVFNTVFGNRTPNNNQPQQVQGVTNNTQLAPPVETNFSLTTPPPEKVTPPEQTIEEITTQDTIEPVVTNLGTPGTDITGTDTTVPSEIDPDLQDFSLGAPPTRSDDQAETIDSLDRTIGDISAVDTTVESDRDVNIGEEYVEDALRQLDLSSRGLNPVDRSIANKALTQNAAVIESQRNQLRQQLAANPNLTEGAKQAMLAEFERNARASTSQLTGTLAIDAQTRAMEAVKNKGQLGTQLASFVEGRHQFDVTTEINNVANELAKLGLEAETTLGKANLQEAMYQTDTGLWKFREDLIERAREFDNNLAVKMEELNETLAIQKGYLDLASDKWDHEKLFSLTDSLISIGGQDNIQQAGELFKEYFELDSFDVENLVNEDARAEFINGMDALTNIMGTVGTNADYSEVEDMLKEQGVFDSLNITDPSDQENFWKMFSNRQSPVYRIMHDIPDDVVESIMPGLTADAGRLAMAKLHTLGAASFDGNGNFVVDDPEALSAILDGVDPVEVNGVVLKNSSTRSSTKSGTKIDSMLYTDGEEQGSLIDLLRDKGVEVQSGDTLFYGTNGISIRGEDGESRAIVTIRDNGDAYYNGDKLGSVKSPKVVDQEEYDKKLENAGIGDILVTPNGGVVRKTEDGAVSISVSEITDPFGSEVESIVEQLDSESPTYKKIVELQVTNYLSNPERAITTFKDVGTLEDAKEELHSRLDLYDPSSKDRFFTADEVSVPPDKIIKVKTGSDSEPKIAKVIATGKLDGEYYYKNNSQYVEVETMDGERMFYYASPAGGVIWENGTPVSKTRETL